MADESDFLSIREGGYRSSRTPGFATGPLDKVTGNLPSTTTSEAAETQAPFTASYDVPSPTAGLASAAIKGGASYAGYTIGGTAGGAIANGATIGEGISSGVDQLGSNISSALGFGESAATGATSTAAEAGAAGAYGADIAANGPELGLGASGSTGATTGTTGGTLSEGLSSGSNIGAGVGVGVLRAGIGLAMGEKTGTALAHGASAGVGAYVGGAIGSTFGPVGTVVGSMIGGTVGDALGGTVKNVAKGIKKIFCFCAGTMVIMADGSTKPVEEIRIGDEVALGGMVMGRGEVISSTIREYLGERVDEGHAVREDGRWLRVRDSALAGPVEEDPDIVYPLVIDRHVMVTASWVISSDVCEVDDCPIYNDEERLAMLNENVQLNAAIDRYMAGKAA